MATHHTARTSSHGPNATMVVGFTALLAILIGALLITLRLPAPAAAPTVAPSAPAASIAPAAPAQSNRIFADEIAGSSAPAVDPAAAAGPQPERLQDLVRPVAAPAASIAPHALPRLSNRAYADEIAGSYTFVLDPAAAAGPQPERLQDLVVAPAASVAAAAPAQSNRFFADEMAAGSGPAVAPVAPAESGQAGPR